MVSGQYVLRCRFLDLVVSTEADHPYGQSPWGLSRLGANGDQYRRPLTRPYQTAYYYEVWCSYSQGSHGHARFTANDNNCSANK